ncbi:LysR family transcriptional regulator [Billgrantia gudaonensis]|uniref:DNA-binding transcriptional regulator, LysR family n=1 Tax=Billgrantia gudaonensis TaxID=376427 RepID=A0A1G9BG28_9GAMM|nr:LysR family transcriptional regulator [Halomonas gudaonensis]SDK38441.1 DNA-binding transcriptional regulator, LysR family [Halomonas gudaonensis]
MLTLKQLETFVQVVELGTFERASQRLNATQSTVSKRISELEQATGLCIFDRSRRNARLTEEGERLLELAYTTLDGANRILELNEQPERTLHRVRIGFTDLAALTWLPGFLRDYTTERPDIRLDITIDMSRTLYQQFQDGELDLVVIPQVPEAFAQPGVEALLLEEVEMAFMARENLVDGPRPIPIGALERYTLISQGKRSGFAQDVNRWLSHQGMAAANLTADNLLALVGLVAAGRGISVLPRLCVQRFAREQGLEILETTPRLPMIGYYALYHGGVRIRLLEELAQRLGDAADFTRPFFLSEKRTVRD